MSIYVNLFEVMREIVIRNYMFAGLAVCSLFAAIAKEDRMEGDTRRFYGENQEKKHEIHYKTFYKEDIKFRKKMWREVNLEITPNKGFFYKNNEIVKFIIEGVGKGMLTPYTSFSKSRKLTREQFMNKRVIPSVRIHGDEGHEYRKELFDARKISLLVIEEELLFHGRRSEWSFDIKSIQIVLPKDLFKTGIRREVAVFDYKELMSYLDNIPRARWRNEINSSANKKFSLAFQERLFSSLLVKIENPGNFTIAEIYGAKTKLESVRASLEEEHKLRCYMDSVWIP